MSFCFAATFHTNTFQRDITPSLLLRVYLTAFSYFLPDKDFTQEISNTLMKWLGPLVIFQMCINCVKDYKRDISL